ncbi:MAG: pilus assembly PilX N-terminal domain-containing protein [Candidatus Omnitrophica bacterium]|nr:pilus assembly PilX N-terminal domain-containing protein [Candidatus Omnitrophota bacterium]
MRNGFALMVAVVILVVLSILGAALVGLFTSGSKGAVEGFESAKAFALADGGMRWIYEYQLVWDRDFTENVSPTGDYGVLGSTPVTLGDGQFWVHYGPTQTTNDIDIAVTAKVADAVRTIQAHLTHRIVNGPSPGPFLTGVVVYAARSAGGSPALIDLTGATGTITGGIQSEGTITLSGTIVLASATPDPPFGESYAYAAGVPLENAKEHPYQDIDFDWFRNRPETTLTTGDVTFQPGDSTGTSATGIRMIDGNVTFGGPAGTVTLAGTMVVTGTVTVQDGIQLITNPSQIDFGQGPANMPSLVAGNSIDLTQSSQIETHGMVAARDSGSGMGGVRLADGSSSASTVVRGTWLVWPSVNGKAVNATRRPIDFAYDGSGLPGDGRHAPWLRANIYQFSQWREEISS